VDINIDKISWPKNERNAIQLYLSFLLKVVEGSSIKYLKEQNDPISISKRYLNGADVEFERELAVQNWWDFIDSNGFIRDFHTPEAVLARLALCFLTPGEGDVGDLSENISFAFGLMASLGADLETLKIIKSEYFKNYI
jgi:hypothetical protein